METTELFREVVNVKMQSRKWFITINNPQNYGMSQEVIQNIIQGCASVRYYCMSDEIGAINGTYHTHVFMECSSGVRFSTVKNMFPMAHIESSRAKRNTARSYVFKDNPILCKDKKDTNLSDTHFEWERNPSTEIAYKEEKGKYTEELYKMIQNGMSNYEIINKNPSYARSIRMMEDIRSVIEDEMCRYKERDVFVASIPSSVGEEVIDSLKAQFGCKNVCVIECYEHAFEKYNGESILVLDNYSDELDYDILNALAGKQPYKMACRYRDKWAQFSVFVIIWRYDCQQRMLRRIGTPEMEQRFFDRIDFKAFERNTDV